MKGDRRPMPPSPAAPKPNMDGPLGSDGGYVSIGRLGERRVMARQHGLAGVGVIVEGFGGYFIPGTKLRNGVIE